MLFSLLPTAAVIVAAWAGAATGPHAPGDGMPELRKNPKPPTRQETSLPAPRPSEHARAVRLSPAHRR
jgi:hypothetical protein